MKLGDRVTCTAYIKPSGNHYEHNGDECCYMETGAESGVEVEDYHVCERFRTIQKEFTGVYVGTTNLCANLKAEYFDNPYGNGGFLFEVINPQCFAVVYYASNKKRIVPIDKMEGMNQ